MKKTRATSPKYFYAIGQLLELAEKMGLQVKFAKLIDNDGRIKGNRVAIREGMNEEKTAFILAHEIMHAAIHHGDILGDQEKEREANEGAKVLLLAILGGSGEMSRKRKDGRLESAFRWQGKVYHVYGRTAAELAENATRKRAELAEARTKHENPRLDDYYNQFSELRQVKPSTLVTERKWYKAMAGVTIAGQPFGSLRIRNIKRRDIETVQAALIASGKAARTVNRYIDHLKHVFKTAQQRELIDKNPCQYLESVRGSSEARETIHRALTKAETEAFFQAAKDDYYYYLFAFLLQTGVRIGEAGALLELDIDDKAIHITKTLTRPEGSRYEIGDSPKTAAGKRTIPVNPSIARIVKRQRARNRLYFPDSAVSTLFRSTEGNILNEPSVTRAITKICKAAGIERFTCHAFRATFATRFIEQRPGDYKILSELLGHSTVKMTLDLYTHVMTEAKTEAMEGISIAF